MEQGWVYVLVNSSIPGLSKVGRTTRPPAERVAELSAATGVATPFVLAFEQAFADCQAAERRIHAELARRGLRVSAAREFFRGPPSEIVRVVLEVAAACGDAAATLPVSQPAEALLAEGERHLLGEGETLQDVTEALRCYRLAAVRGSLVAVERIGAIYVQLAAATPVGRRRALRVLKDGARRGNYYCFVEMAELYAAMQHEANRVKAWGLFFARRKDSFCAEVERGDDRYVLTLRRYIGGCLKLGVAPGHVAEMRDAGEALARHLLDALDALRDAPDKRQVIVAVLHWTYANLLPLAEAPVVAPARPGMRGYLEWLRRPGRATA